MSRAGRASSGVTASSGVAPKLGEHKLLRTKHIDTLEVLEMYSQERNRMQKENQQLQEKIAQMVTTRHSG